MRHLKLIRFDREKTLFSPPERRFEHPAPAETEEPTPRELEVEDLLCRGYSQENIAAIFGRSLSTVSAQASSLYRKRGVHTRIGLLLAYLERKGIFVFPNEDAEPGARERMYMEATAP